MLLLLKQSLYVELSVQYTGPYGMMVRNGAYGSPVAPSVVRTAPVVSTWPTARTLDWMDEHKFGHLEKNLPAWFFEGQLEPEFDVVEYLTHAASKDCACTPACMFTKRTSAAKAKSPSSKLIPCLLKREAHNI
jgi:hypothetical protein